MTQVVIPPSKQKLVSVQACRGLAALMVVLAHLHSAEIKHFSTNMMGIFQFGVLGVDLFFVISGVVISAVTVGKFSPRNAARFIYQRAARVYPIYWLYSAIVLAAFLYNPLWINASSGHRVNIISSFLLIPTNLSMLLFQGWTLSYEIYFYLVFFLLLRLAPGPIEPIVLFLWGGVIVLIASLFPDPTQPVVALITNPLILEFLAGCLVFHLFHRVRFSPYSGFVLVAVSIGWLAALAAWTGYAHNSNQTWIEYSRWNRPLFYGSFASIFLLGLMVLESAGFMRHARTFTAIGDWSYSIYLSHVLLVELISRVISHFSSHLVFPMLVADAIALPLVLFMGYLSYTLLEKPLIALLYKRPANVVLGAGYLTVPSDH